MNEFYDGMAGLPGLEPEHGTELPASSIFSSLPEASRFFEQGSVGYSVTRRPGEFDGLELRSHRWQVQPLVVEKVESSYFENQQLFPPGSVTFDSALLMQQIDHEWHGRGSLVVDAKECCQAGCADPYNVTHVRKSLAWLLIGR